ncbi:methyltransferase domain-containing protein [Sphingorhabdus sp.]|jgi:SAM-dependent methyltransferase|uniref:methyltransferase domain-containing protein n=1 Tax=Sphingorhabdus sp. TaxID=1902408 RepID=UPI0037C58319
MVNKNCKSCGGVAALAYTSHDYNKKISSEAFQYFKCEDCSYIFLDPVPDDIGRFYPTEYYAIPKNDTELEATAKKLQQWKIDTVLQFARKGRLLEIGPAYGLFAFLAKQAGFDVTGLEMDHKCCQFLRETVGINVIESSDTVQALSQQRQFDVIVMWQVFEHLPDPWAVLKAAAERLAPGGIIVLDTPNPDAFQFRVLGHRWAHLDAPRHVTLIPAKLLVKKAQGHGLEAAYLTASDISANGFNGFGWAFSFKNYFGDGILGQISHFLGRVLGKLLIPIERTGWRGSTYTAVLRKEQTT